MVSADNLGPFRAWLSLLLCIQEEVPPPPAVLRRRIDVCKELAAQTAEDHTLHEEVLRASHLSNDEKLALERHYRTYNAMVFPHRPTGREVGAGGIDARRLDIARARGLRLDAWNGLMERLGMKRVVLAPGERKSCAWHTRPEACGEIVKAALRSQDGIAAVVADLVDALAVSSAAKERPSVDVIIIAGGANDARARHAAELARENGHCLVIPTGRTARYMGPIAVTYDEATAGAMVLLATGLVVAPRIILGNDEASSDTHGNARSARSILEVLQRHWGRPLALACVTLDFHALRFCLEMDYALHRHPAVERILSYPAPRPRSLRGESDEDLEVLLKFVVNEYAKILFDLCQPFNSSDRG
jgi:hypothetical protein